MRGLAIVNPRASAYERATVESALATLGAATDLDVVHTTHPRHATELGAKARADLMDAVVVLGGDGTVNETLCGLLDCEQAPIPLLAALPFGCVSVFSRQLGLGGDPRQAARLLAERLRQGVQRRIGVGHVDTTGGERPAGSRWFALSVGIGFDADTVASVERRRSGGRPASTALYARCAVREFYRGRPRVPLAVSSDGVPGAKAAEVVIVGNHAPWTYVGSRPIWATPRADWQLGLDVLSMERLTTVSTLGQLARMVASRQAAGTDHGRVRHHHDVSTVRVHAPTPARWQVDGDAMPPATGWTITARARAVTVPT